MDLGTLRGAVEDEGWVVVPDVLGPEEQSITVEMTAGSLLVGLGGVYHRAGAHTAGPPRLGVSAIFCQPWLRQFENQTLAVTPDQARLFSRRIQRMPGYSLVGPCENVDGGDPIRLLEGTRS